MSNLTIHLRTLTPLWTGGVWMATDRLHETGLVGSLRWWYEAIVRGLGQDACGVIANKCSDNNPCVGCRMFGNTGRLRAFRWQARGGTLAYQPRHPRDLIHIQPPGRATGWYYSPGLVATAGEPIQVNLITLRDDPAKVESHVLTALRVAENWGGLGAKTQHGYGVITTVARCEDGQEVHPDVSYFEDGTPLISTYPVLTDFFFAKFRLITTDPLNCWWDANHLGTDVASARRWAGSTGAGPIAPAVKNQLRFGRWLGALSRQLENYLFGNIPPRVREALAARINVSAVYQLKDKRWEFRVWGWLPKQGTPSGFKRGTFLTSLHQLLTTNQRFWQDVFGANIVNLSPGPPPAWDWREFDAPMRDTVGHFTSPRDFLKSLL